MPRECVPEVAVPWRCFAVAVPNGLLPPIFNTITRTSSEVKFIGLFDPQEERDDSKFYGKLVLWGAMADHTLLFTDTIDSLADLTRSATSAASNDVTMELLSRLLLGALIELDSPKNQQTIAKGPRPQKAPRMGKAPSCWAFDLRRDVRVDLRPWVREYVVGGGKTASVQVLVRGHHKRQAHGPGHKERKWVHIEPYWRGPEDAPIAVRGHRVVAE